MVYRKGTDSINWSEPEYLPNGGDPDLLDLKNGRKLLAFGNFNPRIGGVLIFSERIETNYKITVVDSGPTQIPTKKWLVDSAILTHKELGSTYRISFGLKVGS